MIVIAYLFAEILFAIFLFFLCIAFMTGAPFVPSVNKTAKRMIELAGDLNGKTIIDLGSGDGRLIMMAAKANAKRAIGLEINPMLVFFTFLRILFSPYKNKAICYWKNFWTTSLKDADVVFVYLLPWKMDALAKKLIKEVKPGSLIISNSFIFKCFPMVAKDEDAHVYVFKTTEGQHE
jgi:ribosomal protein L11 methylase PrmA